VNAATSSFDRRKLISLFPPDQASDLTGNSVGQLKQWDAQEFISPAFREPGPRTPFGRLYSFVDLLALRVLSQLRNEHGVSLQHLKEVKEELGIDENFSWCSKQLSVANKKVVITEEDSTPNEVVSKQTVIVIPLREVREKLLADLEDFRNRRKPEDIGQFSKTRNIVQSKQVIAGTRVKVSSIEQFLSEGYSDKDILAQYPSLRKGDVQAVRSIVSG